MNVAVRASSTNDMTKAGSGVADYLNGKVVSGSKAAYQAQDLLKQASELQSLSETTNRQLILQAAETLRKNYRQELSLADLLSSAHMSMGRRPSGFAHVGSSSSSAAASGSKGFAGASRPRSPMPVSWQQIKS